MTLQNAKNEIAKKHGYKNWIDLASEESPLGFVQFYDQAAELYAQLAKAEAWEEGSIAQYHYAIKSGAQEYLNGLINPYKK